jgi:lysophospholipase L1-like esterase
MKAPELSNCSHSFYVPARDAWGRTKTQLGAWLQIAGVVSVLLTACDRIGCKPVAPVRVQLFGDSTMAAPALSSALQASMDASFGPGAVLVSNRGVNGTTSVQLRGGTDGMNLPWPQSVASDVIVINHGINDMLAQASESLGVYQDNLAFFAANTGGAALVFETPNIVGVWVSGTAPYAQAMRDVARRYGVPVADTYSYTAAIDGRAQLRDWFHPSDALYGRIAKYSIAPAVNPIVAHLRCM